MFILQSLIAFLGRAALSLIFIAAGVKTLLDWHLKEQELVNVLHDWMSFNLGVDWMQQSLEFALTSTTILLAAAVFCQIVGGLLVFLGISVRLGALLLILFMAPATFLFHHFWTLLGPDREMQTVLFMKNLSILGGLLILFAYGKRGSGPIVHEKSPSS